MSFAKGITIPIFEPFSTNIIFIVPINIMLVSKGWNICIMLGLCPHVVCVFKSLQKKCSMIFFICLRNNNTNIWPIFQLTLFLLEPENNVELRAAPVVQHYFLCSNKNNVSLKWVKYLYKMDLKMHVICLKFFYFIDFSNLKKMG